MEAKALHVSRLLTSHPSTRRVRSVLVFLGWRTFVDSMPGLRAVAGYCDIQSTLERAWSRRRRWPLPHTENWVVNTGAMGDCILINREKSTLWLGPASRMRGNVSHRLTLTPMRYRPKQPCARWAAGWGGHGTPCDRVSRSTGRSFSTTHPSTSGLLRHVIRRTSYLAVFR